MFGEQYKSLSFSLCCFLHSPVTSSLLGPNTLLHTVFSKALNLRSSLHVSDQVSHPCKTTGKITVLYILNIFCKILMSGSLADFGCRINYVKFLIISCLQNPCYFILLVGALQPGKPQPPEPLGWTVTVQHLYKILIYNSI